MLWTFVHKWGDSAPRSLFSAKVAVTQFTCDRGLSLDEIAAYLGIKCDTVFKGIERQNMPAYKVGNLWKFNRAESMFGFAVELHLLSTK